ncbi:MAG TPA: hypothetical protein PLH62_04205, partial [Ferruginibacter sp.]|nr:hypothetical protein [Ferruginibacter sp.]
PAEQFPGGTEEIAGVAERSRGEVGVSFLIIEWMVTTVVKSVMCDIREEEKGHEKKDDIWSYIGAGITIKDFRI